MQLPMSLQVQDGNIVVGSAYTLIEGLSQDARVTRADEDGLVLGFELQDGAKSMVDIALGKVFSSADHITKTHFADVYVRTKFITVCTFIWSSSAAAVHEAHIDRAAHMKSY